MILVSIISPTFFPICDPISLHTPFYWSSYSLGLESSTYMAHLLTSFRFFLKNFLLSETFSESPHQVSISSIFHKLSSLHCFFLPLNHSLNYSYFSILSTRHKFHKGRDFLVILAYLISEKVDCI